MTKLTDKWIHDVDRGGGGSTSPLVLTDSDGELNGTGPPLLHGVSSNRD